MIKQNPYSPARKPGDLESSIREFEQRQQQAETAWRQQLADNPDTPFAELEDTYYSVLHSKVL